MTYMHFDVFPADSLGWLCRALNTRDAGAIHFFPGFFYVEQSGFSMYSMVMLQPALPEGNQSHRSGVSRRGARGQRRTKPSVDREC